MPSARTCIALCLFLSSLVCHSQSLFIPKNIQAAYQKGTRSADGKPGKNYWQNTATYGLHVNFEPGTRRITATVTITYINNSPDTLKQIWFKLYPNLYKKNTPRQTKIAVEDLTEGLIIDSMWMNDQRIDQRALRIDGTNMTLSRQSVVPGKSVTFRINYHYTLNKGSHNRTGEVDPNAHFIAYFFPRVAVYDDIDGWNTHPYNGSLEFYNDFCRFDAYITVPGNFLVWATGELQNAAEVMNPLYVERLRQAESDDAITTIIDTSDLK